MVYYPLNADLQKQMKNFDKGNFSLWYNKFIPLSSESKLKPCKNSDVKDKDKDKDNYINLYKDKYRDFSNNSVLKENLKKKHNHQMHFCDIYKKFDYKTITIKAKLLTPLVLGIGESHPSETSIVFDHNMGIPYIPSSSIKGINRYSRAVEYILETKDINFSENKLAEESFFGSQTKKGDIIFLDAYPVNMPELKEDIMNPHYSQYYGSDGKNTIKPPSDTENPVPIKFLAVKDKAEFAFRILYKDQKTENLSQKQIEEKIKDFLKRSLTEEGIGAKTSLGYGRFDIQGFSEPHELKESFNSYLEEYQTEEEKFQKKVDNFISSVKSINKTQQSDIDSKFSEWRSDEGLRDVKQIAQAFLPIVKKKKSNGNFTKQYLVIKEILKLEENPVEVNKNDSSGTKFTKQEQAAEKKMKKILKNGSITKRELKKYKPYRKIFPELYKKISELPQK